MKREKKEVRGGDLVVLWMNWFFMCLNFHPGVHLCRPSFSIGAHLSVYVSGVYFAFLSIAFSFCFAALLPVVVGQCIFNLVSQTSLKARSNKETLDISFHPVVSRLQRSV